MIRLLKYLLPILFTVAMCSGERAVSEISADTDIELTVLSVIQATVAPSDSEICLPRQVSASDSLRLMAYARRMTFLQRNCLQFARTRHVFSYSSVMLPSFRLHLLSRLII